MTQWWSQGGAEVSWLLLVVPTWLRTQKGAVTTNNEQVGVFYSFPVYDTLEDYTNK